MTLADGALSTSASAAPAGTGARGARLCGPTLVIALVTAWLVWVGGSTLTRSASLGRVLAGGWAELLAPAVLVLVAVLVVCERRWPAERRELLARGHLHDATFFALHVAVVIPLMTLLGVAFGQLVGAHARWIEVPWNATWPRWAVLGVTLVLMDGANWLAHYADHRITALWRLHAVHHSQEELSVLTSFRAHPFSHLAGFFLATIPVVVLTGDRGMAPVLVTAYVCLGTLPHANVAWSLGPLGKVVVSPAYHRLHHSFAGSEGLNLGVVLTVWDVVAGRARFPEPGAPPCRTGLAGRPLRTEHDGPARWQPALVAAQLVEPFGPAPENRRAPGRR